MRRLLEVLLKPLRPYLAQRIDTIARERLDQFSLQLEEARRAAVETQRVVTDDLDASTEATAILGDSLRAIREELAALRGEVEELRSQLSAEGSGRGRRRA